MSLNTTEELRTGWAPPLRTVCPKAEEKRGSERRCNDSLESESLWSCLVARNAYSIIPVQQVLMSRDGSWSWSFILEKQRKRQGREVEAGNGQVERGKKGGIEREQGG